MKRILLMNVSFICAYNGFCQSGTYVGDGVFYNYMYYDKVRYDYCYIAHIKDRINTHNNNTAFASSIFDMTQYVKYSSVYGDYLSFKYSNGNDTYNNDNEQFVFHSKNRIIDFYAFVIYNQKLCMVNLKNDNIYKSSTFTVQDNKKISIFLHNKNNGKGNYYVLYDGYLYCNPFEDYNASISSLNCDSSQSSPTYSLQGIVIDNPQNGIYISDKKKVVLK